MGKGLGTGGPVVRPEAKLSVAKKLPKFRRLWAGRAFSRVRESTQRETSVAG